MSMITAMIAFIVFVLIMRTVGFWPSNTPVIKKKNDRTK